ncbi:MAG: dihydropteroate synthase [Pseudolysinimonas sp.]
MTIIMGILNVTPDSFSDGGRFAHVDAAIARGLELRDQGATIVDVGGESTRPGAVSVNPRDERDRVIPVVGALTQSGVSVSIDTKNASTAQAAVEAGAQLINDVSGGLADEGMPRVVAQSGVHYCVMHWGGGADAAPVYTDVVAEVRADLKNRVAELVVAGVDPSRILLDPGLGFAKDADDNWALLARLDEIESLGHGVLVGASRKRFVGALLPSGAEMDARDLPSAVISALAARSGAWGVRVHDVPSTRLALAVADRWKSGSER